MEPPASLDQQDARAEYASEDSTIRARRWRLLGLCLWLLVTLKMLPIATLVGEYSQRTIGGTFTTVNFPGPKAWIMPMLQRSVGYRPGELGTNATLWTLISLFTIWLITTPTIRQPSLLRASTRWIALLSVGLLAGALLHVDSIRIYGTDRSMPYILLGILGETLATTLIYLTLAQYARVMRRDKLARWLTGVAIAAGLLIFLGLVPAIFVTEFTDGAFDPPAQLWAAFYGMAALGVAAAAIGCVLNFALVQLRFAFPNGLQPIKSRLASIAASPVCGDCGYDLRGLPSESPCPECGGKTAINDTPDDAERRDKVWLRFVVIGLIGWLVITPTFIYGILLMDFRGYLGGTLPMLNFPAPKVWAISNLQRIVGRSPETPGTTTAFLGMMNLFYIWLITWPHSVHELSEKWSSLRRVARWSAVLGGGAVLGFTLVSRNIWVPHISFWKWIAVSIVVAEGPGTVLVYLYLTKLAKARLGARAARLSIRITIAIGCIMGMSLLVVFPPIGEAVGSISRSVGGKLFFGVFGAVVVATALLAVGLILRLIANMLPEAFGDLPLMNLLLPRSPTANQEAD